MIVDSYTPTADTNGNVIISLAVVDSGAGASGVQKLDLLGGDATYLDGPINGVYRYTVTKNGTFTFKATDNVGNVSDECAVTIGNIDKLNPSVVASITEIAEQDDKYADSGETVTLTYSDATATDENKQSGVVTEKYALTQSDTRPADTNAAWQDYSAAIALNSKGTWYIHAKVADNAGNTVYESFGPYVINNSAPVATDGTVTVKEHESGVDGAHKVLIDLKDYVTDADAADTHTFTVGTYPAALYGSWASKGSGVYEFIHSGHGAQPFKAALEVTYYATDSDGLQSATKKITINVEEINDAPSAPAIQQPAENAAFKDGDSIPLRWTASTDEETAQSSLKYEVQISYENGTTWSAYTTTGAGATGIDFPVNSSGANGSMKLRVCAVDTHTLGAKKSSWSTSPVYLLDNTKPVATVSPTSGGAAYVLGEEAVERIKIDFGFSDAAGSGLAKYGYAFTTNTVAPASESGYTMLTDPSHSITCRTIGTHYLHLYAVDNVGNIYKETIGEFKLVNTRPTAHEQTVTVDEGGSVEITLTGTDNDYGDTINGYLIAGTVSCGTLVQAVDDLNAPIPGRYVYTNDGNDPVQNDYFAFRVCDSYAMESADAIVTIVVNPVNDPPQINNLNASYTWAEDTDLPLVFDIFDPDNLPDELGLTVELSESDVIKREGLHLGRLPNGDIALRITPEPDAYTQPGAPVILTVTVTDPLGLEVQQTVELNVDSVNDPPEARDQFYTILGGGKVISKVNATDVEGDALTFTVVSGPTDGTFDQDADFADNGKFTYTADPSCTGDSVKIEISDGNGGVTTITLHFTADIKEEEDCVTIVRELVFDTEIPDDAEYTLTGGDKGFCDASQCRVEIEGNAVRIFVDVAPDSFGSAFLNLKLFSGGIVFVEMPVPVVIEPRNDPPAVTLQSDFAVSARRAAPFSLQLPYGTASASGKLSSDDSIDGAYAVSQFVYARSDNLLDQPAHGSITVNSDGRFTYTPQAGYVGTDSFYMLVTEKDNDKAHNPAPRVLSQGVKVADTADDLQVRVLVRVEMLPKPVEPPPDPGVIDPVPTPTPTPTPDPGEVVPMPTPTPGPGKVTRPKDLNAETHEETPSEEPDGHGDATTPPAEEEADDTTEPGELSEESVESIVRPSQDNKGWPRAIAWVAAAAGVLLLILLLILPLRIRISYVETPATEGGDAKTRTRTLYARSLHHGDEMRLNVSCKDIEDVRAVTLVLRMGRFYRRRFYEQPLQLTFSNLQATVQVPEKEVYKQDFITVAGKDFV